MFILLSAEILSVLHCGRLNVVFTIDSLSSHFVACVLGCWPWELIQIMLTRRSIIHRCTLPLKRIKLRKLVPSFNHLAGVKFFFVFFKISLGFHYLKKH